MTEKRVLIVDDEPDICELAEITLSRMGLDPRSAHDLDSARKLLASAHFDLCITDMQLPDGNGISLVEHIQQYYAQTPVAVITAHGNMESAVRALKAGAFDFVAKPIDLRVLRNLVTSAIKLPASDLEQPLAKSRYNLLGDAPVMQELRKKITKLARSQAPVFIHGESGCGKELVAHLIHEQGARSDYPFVPVNCGAIPGELMESEFFGHKKGSFTGATTDKDGLFRAAHGGTLFLDEVADLPLAMQVKLLRAIQEKSVRPVGEHHEHPVDVRILSASHKNLNDLVAQGKFREDLFYRINVIELDVPSLRDRCSDIPLLANHLLQQLAKKSALEHTPVFTSEALAALSRHHFAGNVRELENIIERALALSENDLIKLEDLHLPARGMVEVTSPATDLPESTQLLKLEEQERQSIMQALEQSRWNRTAAAKLLGITLRQLRYRLGKLDIE
ncbi:MAG: sigma-54-dependent Fis family transcriptional regulator [Gammaproteobacteria bacterium]|nr:sigma-54-dependent Fis family transcriptional regulator [Gammaproteobacteria bacterium]